MSKRSLLSLLCLGMLFFTLLLSQPAFVSAQQAAPTAPTTQEAPPANSEPTITPQLSSRPPGLQFDAIQRSGGQLRNSQLAQYIATMYRYGVGIAAIAAIVMTVYGGFRYLIGSSMGDIAAGKKIIQDAIAGMLLVLGAYLILQTVNPAVLGFRSIDLKIVTPESLDDGAPDGHPMRDSDTPVDGSAVEQFHQNAPPPDGATRRPSGDVPGGVRAAACNREFMLISDIPGLNMNKVEGAGHRISPSIANKLRETINNLPGTGKIIISDTTRTQSAQSRRNIQIEAACGQIYAGVPRPGNGCRQSGHAAGLAIDLSYNGNYCRMTNGQSFPLYMSSKGWARLCVESWHYEPSELHNNLRPSVGNSQCFGNGNDDLLPRCPTAAATP